MKHGKASKPLNKRVHWALHEQKAAMKSPKTFPLKQNRLTWYFNWIVKRPKSIMANKMKLRECRKVLLSSKSLRRVVWRQSLFIVNLVPLLWNGRREISWTFPISVVKNVLTSSLCSKKELKTFQFRCLNRTKIMKTTLWGELYQARAHQTLFHPARPVEIMFPMNLIWIRTGTSNLNRVCYSNELQSCFHQFMRAAQDVERLFSGLLMILRTVTVICI